MVQPGHSLPTGSLEWRIIDFNPELCVRQTSLHISILPEAWYTASTGSLALRTCQTPSHVQGDLKLSDRNDTRFKLWWWKPEPGVEGVEVCCETELLVIKSRREDRRTANGDPRGYVLTRGEKQIFTFWGSVDFQSLFSF